MKLFKAVQFVFFSTLILFCTAQAQRISVQGNKFIVNDHQIFMLGANTPWINWNEFGSSFDSAKWNNHFDSLHDSGVNCTRVWVSCNGDNASPGIDATGKISAPTDLFWTHVGKLFNIAQNNKIYLMIALISFDHTKNGNTNATYWQKMYKNADNRQSFVDNYAIPFVEKFGDNPYFWSIDVGNELDWVHENDSIHDTIDITEVFDLVARVANGVHANSEVLVTCGTGCGPKYLSSLYGTNYYSDEYLSSLEDGAYLDFYNDHYYDWMYPWFSTPFKKGPSDWNIDEKPCVIGEYPAIGDDSSGYDPAECLQYAYSLGWQGVMPWTSDSVDANGDIDDFGSAFKAWSTAHDTLVFPSLDTLPGPFTLTVTEPDDGAIAVSPQAEQYDRGDTVTLTAVPDEGYVFVRWTGDKTDTTQSITFVMTRNITVSAQFVLENELITNGTFDNGTKSWSLGLYEGGSATASADDSVYRVTIDSCGTAIWHVQLLQAGLSLEADSDYVFSFDASATAARSLFVAVGNASTYVKYLEDTVNLDAGMQHFSYEFTQSESTTNARVEFNMAASKYGIALDNISLRLASGASPVQISANKLVKQNTYAAYDAGKKLLRIQGVSKNMQIEGFTVDGKRIFTRNSGTVDGMLSIPLGNSAPQMIIVRGMINGLTQFSQKLLCHK